MRDFFIIQFLFFDTGINSLFSIVASQSVRLLCYYFAVVSISKLQTTINYFLPQSYTEKNYENRREFTPLLVADQQLCSFASLRLCVKQKFLFSKYKTPPLQNINRFRRTEINGRIIKYIFKTSLHIRILYFQCNLFR